jgi:signal transduction histidine kinase
VDVLRRLLSRLLPSTLFGRLAVLVSLGVLAGHVLALAMMFQFRPPMPDARPAAPQSPNPVLRPGAKQLIEFSPSAQVPPQPGPGADMGPPASALWLDISVRLAVLVVAAWIGARWLSAPVRRLARAAKAFGQDLDHPPLPEDGPQEYRDASRLFNQMQSQIRQQLVESDRFVAAVSHDLRTPLTRLRLRAEGLGDATQKNAFRNDIVQMDEMITATLDYLCGAAQEEAWVPLDVEALVESLVDDQRDCGFRVDYCGTAAPLRAQVSGLRRCLNNLVDNAVRYGGAAHVRMVDSPEQLRIEVHDPGPGLPESELAQVLAPFYRFKVSHHRNVGGVGLGLSIALDIAHRHQGTLTLRNGDTAGLVVTLLLPRLAVQSC